MRNTTYGADRTAPLRSNTVPALNISCDARAGAVLASVATLGMSALRRAQRVDGSRGGHAPRCGRLPRQAARPGRAPRARAATRSARSAAATDSGGGPDAAGARDLAASRVRPRPYGDRARLGDHSEDRRETHRAHLAQAWRAQPRAGDRARVP